MRTRIRSSVLVPLAILLGACEEPNPLNPTLVTVTLLSDVFTYAAVGLENVSDTDTYLWPMTGTQAAVSVTPAITSGSGYLQIRAGDGTVVYGEDIGDEVDGVTEVGAPGIWQIDIVFDELSGSFDLAFERDTVPTAP